MKGFFGPAGLLLIHFLYLTLEAQSSPLKRSIAKLNLKSQNTFFDPGSLKRVVLRNHKNRDYFLKIYLGMGRKEFTVRLDTGLSDVFIPYYRCSGCSPRNNYYCQTSATCFTDYSNIVKQNLGYGSAVGYVGYDQMEINSNIYLPRQSIILLSEASGDLSKYEGVFGLNYNSVGMNHNPSFVSNYLSKNALDKAALSIFLSTNETNAMSELIFGGFDLKFVKPGANLFWLNMSKSSHYSAIFRNLNVNLNQLQLEKYEIIFNSGYAHLTFPNKVLSEIRNIFQTKYKIDCFFSEGEAASRNLMQCMLDRKSSEFPSINFEVDQGYFPIESKDYVESCRIIEKNQSVSCLTKLQSSSATKNIILGLPFYQAYYSVYDFDNQLIGLGESINERWFKVFNPNGTLVAKARTKIEIFQHIEQKNDLQSHSFFNFSTFLGIAVFIGVLVIAGVMCKKYKSSSS